jgi:hypothetical protein
MQTQVLARVSGNEAPFSKLPTLLHHFFFLSKRTGKIISTLFFLTITDIIYRRDTNNSGFSFHVHWIVHCSEDATTQKGYSLTHTREAHGFEKTFFLETGELVFECNEADICDLGQDYAKPGRSIGNHPKYQFLVPL